MVIVVQEAELDLSFSGVSDDVTFKKFENYHWIIISIIYKHINTLTAFKYHQVALTMDKLKYQKMSLALTFMLFCMSLALIIFILVTGIDHIHGNLQITGIDHF